MHRQFTNNAQAIVSSSEAPPPLTFLYGGRKVVFYLLFSVICFVLLFELGSPSAAQAGLKPEILLPQPFERWNYKQTPPTLGLT